MCELPGAHANVCGDVYVDPSTTIEPAGLAVTIIETVTGNDVVVLVELVIELVVELVVVVVVVVCDVLTSSMNAVLPLAPSMCKRRTVFESRKYGAVGGVKLLVQRATPFETRNSSIQPSR